MSKTNSTRTGALAMLLGSALTFSGLALGTAKADTPAAAPAATAATAPEKPKLVVTGLFDGYLGYFGSNPKSSGSAVLPTPTAYAFRNSTPTLSLAELNVSMAPPSDGGFGFKGTFQVGDTADANVGFGTNTWESRYKNIGQLYGTWGFAKGGELDFGKFYTPFGYEVVESNANFNYTRSIPYVNLLPIYHTGFRLVSPVIGKGLTLTGEVVNSISNTAFEGVSDDNGSKGYIGQANWTDPKGKYVFVETLGYSEDIVGGSKDKLLLSDTDLTWNLDAKNILAGNYTYRKDDFGGGVKTTTNGYAVYYRHQFNTDAIALRYSGASSSGSPNPQEVTGTFEMKTSPSWLTRFEYRHDFASQPIYMDSTGAPTKKNQDLGVVSEVFTFGG